MLSCILECFLDNFGWEPGKVGAIPGIVNDSGLDRALVNLIEKITCREDVVFKDGGNEHVLIDDGAMLIVTKLVKQLVGWVSRKV